MAEVKTPVSSALFSSALLWLLILCHLLYFHFWFALWEFPVYVSASPTMTVSYLRILHILIFISDAKYHVWNIIHPPQMSVIYEWIARTLYSYRYLKKLKSVRISHRLIYIFRCLCPSLTFASISPWGRVFVYQGEMLWQDAIEAGLLFWAPEVTCSPLLLTKPKIIIHYMLA